jgi:spermidine/putrescine transport system permease protein
VKRQLPPRDFSRDNLCNDNGRHRPDREQGGMSETSGWARFRGSEAGTGLSLIGLPGLFVILMLAAPLVTVLLTSFYTDGTNDAGAKAVLPILTLENYREVFTSPIYQALMLRSLGISMLVTLITVMLAYPIAYYVSFYVSPSRKSLWLFLITIPFWTSYIIRVFLWKVVLGYNGVFSSALTETGLLAEPVSFLTNGAVAVTVTLAHAYAPFAILPIFVALEKIDRSFLEAGQDLGESRFRTFLRVTLPLSMPGVIAAAMIVFIPTVGDYVTPELMGGGKYPMIANAIEIQMLKLRHQALGASLAVTAMAIVTVVTLVFLLINRRFLRGNSR